MDEERRRKMYCVIVGALSILSIASFGLTECERNYRTDDPFKYDYNFRDSTNDATPLGGLEYKVKFK